MQTEKLASQSEKMARSAQIFEQEIAAGGTYQLTVFGNYFYFIIASGDVTVRTDKCPPRPYTQGTGERFIDELTFNRLEITNATTGTILVKLFAGFGDYIDNRFAIIESETKCLSVPTATGWTGSVLSAATTLTLTGAPVAGLLQRKAVIIANRDSANDLEVWDENNALLHVVFFRTAAIVPAGGVVKVRNANGSAVSCAVSEIWYVAR